MSNQLSQLNLLYIFKLHPSSLKAIKKQENKYFELKNKEKCVENDIKYNNAASRRKCSYNTDHLYVKRQTNCCVYNLDVRKHYCGI